MGFNPAILVVKPQIVLKKQIQADLIKMSDHTAYRYKNLLSFTYNYNNYYYL